MFCFSILRMNRFAVRVWLGDLAWPISERPNATIWFSLTIALEQELHSKLDRSRTVRVDRMEKRCTREA
jgi:hypothetical protein